MIKLAIIVPLFLSKVSANNCTSLPNCIQCSPNPSKLLLCKECHFGFHSSQNQLECLKNSLNCRNYDEDSQSCTRCESSYQTSSTDSGEQFCTLESNYTIFIILIVLFIPFIVIALLLVAYNGLEWFKTSKFYRSFGSKPKAGLKNGAEMQITIGLVDDKTKQKKSLYGKYLQLLQFTMTNLQQKAIQITPKGRKNITLGSSTSRLKPYCTQGSPHSSNSRVRHLPNNIIILTLQKMGSILITATI